jgi:hypothetical protein
MNQPNDTRLIYDSCSYNEKLKRTIGPGLYSLNRPYNDCIDCKSTVPDDPSMRFQAYGPNTCTMKTAVDDSSELLGLNYKKSKCNLDEYTPGNYVSTSGCSINVQNNPRDCWAPREDTKLSNPPCNLKGTGINRWDWLCYDPQERAIEGFDRVPVNYRMVAKDNHVPIIDTPQDQSVFFPTNNTVDNADIINNWQKGNARNLYAPGNPQGNINYGLKCK